MRFVWTAVLMMVSVGAPVARAQSAFTAGMAATIGDGWQIQGADLGLVLPFGVGPLRSWSLVGRVGSFIDQRGFFADQRGIVGGLVMGARSKGLRLAELGNEPNLMWVTFDVTLEVAGYVAANSPLEKELGSRWMGAALLSSLRMGEPGGTQYALLIGPSAFLGPRTDVRVFFGLRAEWPLARQKSSP